MERGNGKAPWFDGTNYPYWKIQMRAYLNSIRSSVWEICENTEYVVLAARVGQIQIDQHKANSKARNALLASISLPEFERVSELETTREIWVKL